MKRTISIIILLSMVLHCASRLGFISYLYSNRHDIAYSVGLIAEIPIAICSSDSALPDAPLIIEYPQDADTSVPVHFGQAKEIVLFLDTHQTNSVGSLRHTIVEHNTTKGQHFYASPHFSIFHPPSC